MGQTLSGLNIVAQITGSVSDEFALHTPASSFRLANTISPDNGSGTDQANRENGWTGKLAPSGTATIDLNGTNKDVYGDSVTMDTLRALHVINSSNDINSSADIHISTNGLGFVANNSDKIVVRAGGSCLLVTTTNGWTVTAGSADTIVITNASAADGARYKVLAIGTEADVSSSSSSYSSASSSSSSTAAQNSSSSSSQSVSSSSSTSSQSVSSSSSSTAAQNSSSSSSVAETKSSSSSSSSSL